MAQPHRVVYHNFAGISLTGPTKWDPATVDKHNHLDKATWLTSAAEVGALFGTVQSYDGAGISCGIDQKIALFPKTMLQGELWKFLQKIVNAVPATNPNLVAVLNGFSAAGWALDGNGVLKHTQTGIPVSGSELRNEFAPVNGVVPVSGPAFDKAVHWVQVLSNLFADPATFPVQIRETKNDLLTSQEVLESQVYSTYCHVADASLAIVGTNTIPELDLAMCVYHSFSVNAPGEARRILRGVLSQRLGPIDFSKHLVRALGTDTFGNWQTRYTRTRGEALGSGLFDPAVIASICPATL